MLKKVFGSFIAASILYCGFGSIDSEASEWNQSSVKVEQSSSGWERMIEVQRERMDEVKSEIRGSASSMQRHSVHLSSYQLQSGYSKGAASAAQKSEIKLDVDSKLKNGSTKLEQSTNGSGIMEQTSSAKNGVHLLQSQSSTTCCLPFPSID